MAKKTLYKIFAFGVSVITITAVLILSVFYSYSDNQLKEQLRVVESVVENQLAQDDDTAFISNHIDKNVRITLVAKDGTVIADSQESANKLGNHLNRQEIQQAIKAIYDCAARGQPANATTLSPLLEEKAYSQVMLAQAQNADTRLNRRDIDMLLDRLQTANPESAQVAGTTGDEFRQKFAALARKKVGERPPEE